MNPYSLLPLIASLLILSLGCFVLSHGLSSRVNRAFFAQCMTVSTWGLGYACMYNCVDERLAALCARVVYVGVVFVVLSFHEFVVALIGRRTDAWRLGTFGFTAGFALLVLLTDTVVDGVRQQFWGFQTRAGYLHDLFLLYFGLVCLKCLLDLRRAARAVVGTEVDTRQRIQYVLAAYVIAILASLDFLSNYGIALYPFGFVFITGWVILMAYAIVRLQLMDITVVIKKTFIYSLLLLSLIAPCYAAVILIQEAIPSLYYPFLGGLFIVVGFVFPRFRFRTEQRLENVLFRRSLDSRRVLAAFSSEIIALPTVPEILARAAETVRRATDARSASIFLLEGGRYVPGLPSPRGPEARDAEAAIPADDLIPVHLAESGAPVHRRQLARSNRPDGGRLDARLEQLAAQLIVPLLFERRLTGFILLSERDSAGGYSSEEIALLETIASQVAMAIENIRKHQEVDKLKELDSLKNALFSKVSHELRTPLTNILLPLQRVLFERGQQLHPENRQEKEAMLSNGLKLLKRINEILDLSKLQSGKMSLVTSQNSLADVLAEVVSAASPAAEAMGIRLSFRAPSNLPAVYVNREQMEKVFANVIGNAVKFTQDGGRITGEISEAEKHLVVSVADTGCGIPEADLPFIFDRFRQVDGATSRMYEGTGLGLALVKELVELHRGRVEVESELGRGTTFRVWLPKGREHLSDEEVVEPEEQPSEAESADRRRGERRKRERREGDRRKGSREDEHSLRLLDVQLADFRPSTPTEAEQVLENGAEDGRRRVLVVEDNRDLARNIAVALRSRYSVSLAYDGLEGLEVARQISPDVIVSDVMMPRMDGFELCRTIKSEPGGDAVPMILLTAKAEVEDRIAGFRQGADHYLAKPFNANELTVVIESLLSRYDLQRELECANTQLQKALQELAEAQVQLVHSARIDSVGELAAGVAHEVKNSIYCVRTGLSGLEKRLQYIQEGKLSLDTSYPEMLQAFHVNSQALDRSLFIVNSLLDFSRASRDGMARSDLVKGIENTLAILTPRVRDKLEVQTRFDGNLAVECKIDEINQVLMNLVLNAYQAIPEHGTVIIEAQESSDSVALRITDDGPGIPEAQLGKIFLPFFTTKEKSGNSGLGLSIAHNIVKAHHGEIAVESTPGQGTSFTITLPKRQPVAATA